MNRRLLPVAVTLALSFCIQPYASLSAPDLSKFTHPYAHLQTAHFDIYIEDSDDKHPLGPYYANIESLLEYAWERYGDYTGYDPNSVLRGTPQQGLYTYEILDPSDMWIKGWGGGLTEFNTSQVANSTVPLMSPKQASENEFGIGVLWHELANGWGVVRSSYQGQLANLPEWYENEGHAGFLKYHAQIDGGYRAGSDGAYAQDIKVYDQYIADHKAGTSFTGNQTEVTIVLLESLYGRYGWKVERGVDHLVQTGQLMFNKDTPEDEKSGVLAADISLIVHGNILPFLDANYIPVSSDWRQRIEAMHLAPANISIDRDLKDVVPADDIPSPWPASPYNP